MGQAHRHDRQECPEVDVFLEGKPKWQVERDVIEVAATFAFNGEVTGRDQLGHDPLGPSLGYVEGASDVTKSDARIARDQKQGIAVVRQEAKVGLCGCGVDLVLLTSDYLYPHYITCLEIEVLLSVNYDTGYLFHIK
jgi:hypothetical protein